MFETRNPKVDLRGHRRQPVSCAIELIWKSETGEKRYEQCTALDFSDSGLAIECPESIPMLAYVIVRAPSFEIAALARVRHCSWRRTIYNLGLHFVAKTSTVFNDPGAPDHYEILRLSPNAEPETIERVYRTLAKRLHPDNPETGDAEVYLRVVEAYRILSDPKKRREYDSERMKLREAPVQQLRSNEFFAGLQGEQNRRIAILCLLYRKRSSDFETPGMTMLDLELVTGFTREELGFALWYLSEKSLTRVGDDARYCITASGVDYTENRLSEDQGHLRVLAALEMPERQIAPPSAVLGAASEV